MSKWQPIIGGQHMVRGKSPNTTLQGALRDKAAERPLSSDVDDVEKPSAAALWMH